MQLGILGRAGGFLQVTVDVAQDQTQELHPAAAAIWLTAALALDLGSNNPVYRLLLLLALVNTLLATRPQNLKPLLRGATFALVTATALSGLLAHSGRHVIFVFPASFPLLGGPITAEGFLFGLDTGMAIIAALLAIATFSRISSMQRLVDIMPSALQSTGFVIASAASMLPSLLRSTTAIAEAQRMRGWQPRRLRSLPLVAVPVVVGAIEDSIQLAEVMEIRGYGSGKRTLFRRTYWDTASILPLVCSLIAIALLCVAISTHDQLNWYPFPQAGLPAIQIWLPLASASLALPLLLWPASSK